MVLVRPEAKGAKPFCIDAYEGSLLEGDASYSPFETIGSHHVRAVSRSGVLPQAYISRNESAAACHASGKRLCTEDEWVTACRGPAKTTYPYGSTDRPGVCNDQGHGPLVTLYAAEGANVYGDFRIMNDPRLNQEPHTIAPTGSHDACSNAYGVFDMVGNVHEWVDDPNGTFRGGYYLDTHQNGDGCGYRTTAHDALYHDYSTGFRCCATPP
jgi:formylglycine-generating enzyme required for sulfatase activity